MADQAERAEQFLELHRPGDPLLMPNAWDAGSAKILASLGFRALATTSSGSAATLGLLDGSMSREEALANAGAIVAATELPVSADLENGFANDPDGVVETIRLAIETGLAGCSVEDFSGEEDQPIYDVELATERVAAAAGAAHSGPVHLVLTARAENFLHGRADLDDTIARLQRYADAGADVVFAPGLPGPDEIRAVVAAVDVPVSVLVRPGYPSVAELGEMGVARISVGGSFAFAALASLIDAGAELLEQGTYGYGERTARGIKAARASFERIRRGPMIASLDFVAIPSQDSERARSFYVDTLGLRPDEHGQFEFWAGDTCLTIWEPERLGAKFAPQKNGHLALHVDDVPAARAELEQKGVTFAGETFDTGVCHMALFIDPDGNDLMLHHRYAPYD